MRAEKIGIVGSGLIGRAWCMLFTSAGYQVQLYDVQEDQMHNALTAIESELHALEAAGQLHGKLSAREQFKCISLATGGLQQLCTADNIVHIQECIPERLEWKRDLYSQLDEFLNAHTIVCSSTSTFMPSHLSVNMKHHKNQVMVAHPLNPPYFIPLVELVPTPWTSASAVARTRDLMLELGQRPVVLQREVEGFITNRLQYALLSEAWHLVTTGVVSASDLDAVMTCGLGMRYAFSGPLETAHLNASDGIRDYFERYGAEINTVCASFAPPPNMNPLNGSNDATSVTVNAAGTTAAAELKQIAEQCEAMLPVQQLAGQRIKRSKFLTALAQLKQQQNFQ